MSICDRCIHDEVCGLEDNHEEAITFCAYMNPKDVLDKIRAEIEQIEINGCIRDVECFSAGINAALTIINKYKAKSSEG